MAKVRPTAIEDDEFGDAKYDVHRYVMRDSKLLTEDDRITESEDWLYAHFDGTVELLHLLGRDHGDEIWIIQQNQHEIELSTQDLMAFVGLITQVLTDQDKDRLKMEGI